MTASATAASSFSCTTRRAVEPRLPHVGGVLAVSDQTFAHLADGVGPRGARVIATIHGQARRSGSVETLEPPMPRWLEASARPAAGLAILTRRIHRPVERSISEDESWRNGTSKLTRTPARNA